MLDIVSLMPAYILILVRLSSFFIMTPLFSYRSIPMPFRIGFAVFFSWITLFAIGSPSLEIDSVYYLLIIKEALVGIAIGFMAFLMLSAIQIAGGFIDFQMGFAVANVIDPQTGAQSPLVGQYLYTMALLLLLAVNGHHLLIDGMFYSYEFIPLDQVWLPFGDESVIQFIIVSFAKMFMTAYQLAIPIVGSIFIVDVALGIVARTVPQLNVFVVGLPIKITVSFIVMFIVMSLMLIAIGNLIELTIYTMRGFMELLGGL